MAIKRLLIVNRGEIARRIIRTCKRLDIETVLISSEADAHWPATREADEVVVLEGNTPAETYLNQKKVLAVAKKHKVDAVHPGYGFLSENSDFARGCKKEELIFIGPSAQVLDQLGDKIAAKKAAERANVPTAPGTSSPVKSVKEAKSIAKKFGYPILLKAAGGGGGRGMRPVYSEKELEEHFLSAKREAKGAFGNDNIFIEKFLDKVKHIEVQAARDKHGNAITFGERDCSAQRRHQKLIEEAPGPSVTPALRKKLCDAAKRLFNQVKYEGIGTVEFLVDAKKNIFFMEVNPRIQVEHPVTELVTGMDFVELQIQIALGKKIKDLEQSMKGHAIEIRLLAENAYEGGVPSVGRINDIQYEESNHQRMDLGVESGSMVSEYYDSMIGKVICFGKDRSEALTHLKKTLLGLRVRGVITNTSYALSLIKKKTFVEGKHTTHWIGELEKEKFKTEHEHIVAALSILPKKYKEREDGPW